MATEWKLELGDAAAISDSDLFQAIPGHYAVLDPDYNILAATDEFLAMAMAERDDVIGRNMFEAFPDPAPDEPGRRFMIESLERVKRDLVPDVMAVQRYDVRMEEGGEFVTRFWSVLNTPVLDENGDLRVIIERAEDVTDFVLLTQAAGADPSDALNEQVRRSQLEIVKRADELQAANRLLREASVAKNQFLSRMSHELRTPLTAILGFGELLALSDLDSEDAEAVSVIQRAGDHLLRLVNEVLDLARIEAGELTISVEPVSPHEVVTEAFELMVPLARSADIELTAEHSDFSRDVLADHQRLKQVLINLISNAVKFNRPGGRVTVSLEPSGENTLRISVADTGLGIDAPSVEKLFVPFERLGAERAGIEGTGIGLALSQNLMELMSGSLDVTSDPGIGSTFSVELKTCQHVSAPHEQRPDHTVLEPRRFGRERRVLYIEDKFANVQLVRTILRRRPDVELTTAMLGETGIEEARQLRPHLILLDIHLPDIDGPEVLRRLRGIEELANTRVVVLSADATMMRSDELAMLGAEIYMTKPITVEGLLNVVDDCLAKVA
jgi:signal transduction histidine kinase